MGAALPQRTILAKRVGGAPCRSPRLRWSPHFATTNAGMLMSALFSRVFSSMSRIFTFVTSSSGHRKDIKSECCSPVVFPVFRHPCWGFFLRRTGDNYYSGRHSGSPTPDATSLLAFRTFPHSSSAFSAHTLAFLGLSFSFSLLIQVCVCDCVCLGYDASALGGFHFEPAKNSGKTHGRKNTIGTLANNFGNRKELIAHTHGQRQRLFWPTRRGGNERKSQRKM